MCCPCIGFFSIVGICILITKFNFQLSKPPLISLFLSEHMENSYSNRWHYLRYRILLCNLDIIEVQSLAFSLVAHPLFNAIFKSLLAIIYKLQIYVCMFWLFAKSVTFCICFLYLLRCLMVTFQMSDASFDSSGFVTLSPCMPFSI